MGTQGIVTARARRWVERFLTATERMPVSPGEIMDFIREAKELGGEVLPAVVEATESDDEGKALWASWVILVLDDCLGAAVSREEVCRAEEALRRCLAGGTNALTSLACFFLRLGGGRGTFLGLLLPLLECRDAEISIAAAGAILQIDPSCKGARGVLKRAVKGKDDVVAAVAAADLLRAGDDDPKVLAVVRDRFLRLNDTATCVVLMALKHASNAPAALFDAVAEIATNESALSSVRQLAAAVVGKVGNERSETEAVLLRAMQSPDWRVVDGAIEGFQLLGRSSREAGERLALLLTDPDESMRFVAARGLRAMKSDTRFALAKLVERLEAESSIDVANAIAMAIAAMGSPAIPALLEIIKKRNIRTAEVAMRALASLGEEAAEVIARLYWTFDEATPRKLLAITLSSMGPDVGPAVPLMAKLLDETDDDELALYVAMGLFGAGSNAAPAMDALVRCVADQRSDAVREWAERAIGAIGPEGIAAVRNAAASASARQKIQLDAAIARLSVLDDQRFKHLESLGDDSLLDMFVHVAEFIIERGPTSYAKISAVFEKERDIPGGIAFPTSSRALGVGIKQLEKHVGLRLVNRIPGRKGGLTSEGMRLLAEVKEYLSLKRRRLG